jgi:hypothetical protein
VNVSAPLEQVAGQVDPVRRDTVTGERLAELGVGRLLQTGGGGFAFAVDGLDKDRQDRHPVVGALVRAPCHDGRAHPPAAD